MFDLLDTLPCVLIGRVHGAALGGGAGLAAVCDIVVAADDAIFGFTEVKLGIMPAMIAPYATGEDRAVGVARTVPDRRPVRQPQRAREIGLVHAVGEDGGAGFASRWQVRETTFLTSAPQAVAAAKALIADVAQAPSRDAATALTVNAIADRRVSPEGQDGMRAFLDKRPPSWLSGGS